MVTGLRFRINPPCNADATRPSPSPDKSVGLALKYFEREIAGNYQERLADKDKAKAPFEMKPAELKAQLLAWQQTGKGEYGKYVAPNFEAFFPDDREGGVQLDQLFQSRDKDCDRTTKS